jgi:hypothetical protein
MSYEEVGGDLSIMLSAPFVAPLKWAGWWGSSDWKPYTGFRLEDVSATFAEEGMPIQMFFGRLRLRNPNVVWFGNLSGLEYQESYYYEMNVAMAFGIPMGVDKPGGQNPGTVVRRVWWEDKQVFPSGGGTGNWTTGTQRIAKSLGLGRIPADGNVTFHGGAFDQSIDTNWLADLTTAGLDNTLLGNLRGIAYVYFHGSTHTTTCGYKWGGDVSLPQLSWELEAVTHPLGMSDINSEGDANPAEVIYDILTNPWGKIGLATSDVDTAAFTAAATTLHNEGHGISLVIDKKVNLRSVIQGILRQIDGVLYVEPSTGKVTITLIREDYSVETLPAFDKTNVIKVEDYAVTLWEGSYNEVRLEFSDRAADYATRPAYAHDSASIVENGRKTLELSFPGVCTAELANKLAARELHSVSLPRVAAKIRVNRDAIELRPGGVFKWSDEDYGITDMVMRIVGFDLGEFDDNSIAMLCVRDSFDTSHEVFSEPPPVFELPDNDADDVEVWDAIECPRWFNLIAAQGGNEARWFYLAKQPSAETVAFTARRERVNGEGYFEDKTGCPFSGYAELESWKAQYYGGEVDTIQGVTIENPSSGLIASITAATASQIKYNSKNLILIDEEIMGFEDIIDNEDDTWTLKPLWRGLVDTVPKEHDAGARVWFFQIYDVQLWDKMGNLTEPIGTAYALFARLYGENNQGEEIGQGSSTETFADPQEIELDSRAVRPVPPDMFGSRGSYDNYTFEQATLPYSSLPLNETAMIDWLRRDRDASKVYNPEDSDDAEPGVVYNLEVWTPEDGWVEAVAGVNDTEVHIPLERNSYVPDTVDALAHIIADDGEWESKQKPTIEGDIHLYRNHLVNGNFEDGTLRGWIADSGSPSVTDTGNTRYGDWSLYVATGADDYTISQTRWIDAWEPEGLTAIAIAYIASTDTNDSVTVTIQPLEADDTPIGSPATSGAVAPYGSTKWRRIEVTFDDLPADTAKLKVTVAVDIDTPSGDLRIADCELYVGNISAQLLTDPSFEASGLPAWTQEAGTWYRDLKYDFEGTYAAGYNDASDGTISQTVLIPAGFEHGVGYVWFHAEGTPGKSDMKVQVRNSGGTPIYQSSKLPIGNQLATNAWVYYTAGYDIKVFGYCDGDTDPEIDYNLDNFRLFIFKFTKPLAEDILDFGYPSEHADRFHAADYEWEDYGASKPAAIWLFEDDGVSGQFKDELSEETAETNLWLDIVSDTNHVYEQTICGFYDLGGYGSGFTSKIGLETREGTNVGADLPNTADASMDGSSDFALLEVFSAKRSSSDRYLAGSGTTVGWSVKLRASDGALELYVGSSGDNDSIVLTEDYRDGAQHYFVVWYDATAGTFRLWTDLESPSAVSMPTGDCSNGAAVRVGGVATQTSPASQLPYGALWRSATLTPTMTNSWWAHGQDPTEEGYIDTHNLNVPVAIPVGVDADGAVLATYSPGQIPIAYHDSGWRGLCCYKAQTNLLADSDPNSDNWVEEGSPYVYTLFGMDAQRWKRGVYLQSDNVDAYRPPAITQGAGDITVVWYQFISQDYNARLCLKQTDHGNPINYDYKPATEDVGTWQRFEHTFAWAGGTSAFELWFHGSADGTPRITVLSAPIVVIAGDEAQMILPHGTDAVNAFQCILDESKLPDYLRTQGEVKIKSVMKNDVGSSAEEHLINMNGGNNLGRRVVLRDAADNLDFYHYDGSGVLATGTITSPANWDKLVIARARWNYGGLLEDDAVFAEIDGRFYPYTSSSDDDARTATWTVSGNYSYQYVSIGGNSGSDVMNGILNEITFSGRERSKPS